MKQWLHESAPNDMLNVHCLSSCVIIIVIIIIIIIMQGYQMWVKHRQKSGRILGFCDINMKSTEWVSGI